MFTIAEYSQAMPVGFEAVLAANLLLHAFEVGAGELDDPAASGAHEVVVMFAGWQVFVVAVLFA